MRTNVLVIAGLAVLSTSAFASKARMEALGQGSSSYYLTDSRSVFLNPASLNDLKNYVVTEWGTAATADTAIAPRAEGGFFREMGAFSYGLYLGNNTSRTSATGVTTTQVFKTQSNGIDLFLAGDMGMKWGARVHYSGLTDETLLQTGSVPVTTKHSALGLGLGVAHGDLDASLNIDLSDKSEGTSGTAGLAADKSEQKPSFTLHAGYNLMGSKVYASYAADKREETLTAALITTKNTDMRLGLGKIIEVNPTARVITDIALIMTTNDISGTGKAKTNKLPLTIGLETEATSWLTLRGSVSQNVVLGETKSAAGKKSSLANSTIVNGGATLTFGKLKVDGVVGTSAAARNGALTTTNTGVLTTDNLMSRVGVTYSF